MPTKSGLAELPVVLEPHDVMTSVAITLREVRAPIVRKPPRVGCFTLSLLRGSSWSPVADGRNWSAAARLTGRRLTSRLRQPIIALVILIGTRAMTQTGDH